MARIRYDVSEVQLFEQDGAPLPGDVVITYRRRDDRPTGTMYLIHGVREVAQFGNTQHRRFYLQVERLPPGAAAVSKLGVRSWPLYWDPRRPKMGRMIPSLT